MIKLAKPIPPTPAMFDIQMLALSPLFADLIAGKKTAHNGMLSPIASVAQWGTLRQMTLKARKDPRQ